jgi:hypothetical protein
MTSSAVTSLAILKVNWERLGRDYLDNLIPFVVSVVCGGSSGAISLPAVQSDVQKAFRLHIPLNPLKTILGRMASKGHLRRESGTLFTQMHDCDDAKFDELRNVASSQISLLVGRLAAFAKERFGVGWSGDEAEEGLLSFIADEGLEALYAKAEGKVVPVRESAIAHRFIVGAFVTHIQGSEPGVFEEVIAVVKGYVLSNALYLPDPGSVQQRFNKTTVYCDTGFLIFACGFAGKDRQAPCTELLTLLRTHGARLGCYRETVEEVRGILDACAAMIRKKDLRTSYGPSMEYFIHAGTPSTDIDLLAARCEKHIEGLGIHIEDRPDVDRASQIDEAGLEHALQEAIGYKRRNSLVHDVNCVTAIMRHRKGEESHSIENCRAIFVTTNSQLATVARRFLQPDATPGAVAPVLSSHALGHLMWLKDPTAAPTLPIRQVIADAVAAMQPSESLWKAYLVEIARLEAKGSITGEQYLLLRHSHTAKRALMDLTRGDPAAFVEGTVAEVLEVARRNMRADLEEELSVTRGTLTTKESEIVELLGVEADRQALLIQRAEQLAGPIARGLFWGVILGLSVATVYTFPWALPQPDAGLVRYTMFGLQFGLLVYVIASMKWGTTLDSLEAKVRAKLASFIASRLSSWLSPAPRASARPLDS